MMIYCIRSPRLSPLPAILLVMTLGSFLVPLAGPPQFKTNPPSGGFVVGALTSLPAGGVSTLLNILRKHSMVATDDANAGAAEGQPYRRIRQFRSPHLDTRPLASSASCS